MKKLFAVLLAACMLLSMAACSNSNTNGQPIQSSAQTEDNNSEQPEENIIFAGGSGTEDEPYQIASAEQFLAFAVSVNDGSCSGYAGEYIQLIADIDLDGTTWAPIGNMDDMETYSMMFSGIFDGNNHTISNLTYESDEFNCGAGLFGVNCGIVKNLMVKNATVTVTEGTSLAIGGVVGYNMGAVDNVTIDSATITGNNCTGGLIGGNNSAVTNCKATNVTVIVIGDNDFSGGLVQDDIAECGGLLIGDGFGGTIDNCTASGTVRATGNEPVGLGGIGGCLEMMDSITNCSATVTWGQILQAGYQYDRERAARRSGGAGQQ